MLALVVVVVLEAAVRSHNSRKLRMGHRNRNQAGLREPRRWLELEQRNQVDRNCQKGNNR